MHSSVASSTLLQSIEERPLNTMERKFGSFCLLEAGDLQSTYRMIRMRASKLKTTPDDRASRTLRKTNPAVTE